VKVDNEKIEVSLIDPLERSLALIYAIDLTFLEHETFPNDF